MFRIAICEDEKVVLDFESSLIKQWAESAASGSHEARTGIAIELDTYVSAEQFLFESEDKPPYDVLIFDIQMKNMNGMELAKTLRRRGCDSVIIFVTGVPDYAIEGYEVGAIRYLLKPLKTESFFALLDSVYQKCQKKPDDYFVLSQGGDMERIPYEKIIYFEAHGHYVFIKGTDFEREWKSSFSEVVEILCKSAGTDDGSDKSGCGTGGDKAGCDNSDISGNASNCDTSGNNGGITGNASSSDTSRNNGGSTGDDRKTTGQFFCLRRGLLVNLEHVSRITRTDCVLDNGESLPVARGVYKELNESFIKLFKGGA